MIHGETHQIKQDTSQQPYKRLFKLLQAHSGRSPGFWWRWCHKGGVRNLLLCRGILLQIKWQDIIPPLITNLLKWWTISGLQTTLHSTFWHMAKDYWGVILLGLTEGIMATSVATAWYSSAMAINPWLLPIWQLRSIASHSANSSAIKPLPN